MSSRRQVQVDLALLACWMLGSGSCAVALGQDLNFDFRNYHLYNPHALLAGRIGRDVAPASIQSFLNPLLDVPFYVMVRSLPAAAVGFLLGAVQGVNGWLTSLLARRALAHRGPVIALALANAVALVGYSGAMNRMEIGTVFGDNLVSPFLLGALLLVDPFRDTRHEGRPSRLRGLVAAGLMVGMAAGLKMTMMLYLIPFLIAIPAVADGWRDRARRLVVLGVSAIVGFLLTAGYWMVLMERHYDSPLFPFFNAYFRSEYFDPVNFADARLLPRNLLQRLFYPFYFARSNNLVFELVFRDIRLAVTYLLLGLWALAAGARAIRAGRAGNRAGSPDDASAQRRARLLALALFATLSYVIWQQQFSIYRFLVPLEFLSIVLVALLLDRLIASRVWFTWVAVALLATIALTVKAPDCGHVPWGNDYVAVRYHNDLNLENAVVVLDQEPLSYLIPYFPESTLFVRLDGWFWTMTRRFKEEFRAVLEQSDRPMYGIARPGRLGGFDRALREFGRTVEADRCSPLEATGYPQGLALCRLSRVETGVPAGK